MWFILALFSGFAAAALAVLIKLYLKHLNAFFVAFFFSLIIFLMLLIVDIFTQRVGCKLLVSLTTKELGWLVLAGIINALAFVCYLTALKCGHTGGAIALDRLGIVFTIVLAAIFLQESISIQGVIGALMMVLGAFLIVIQ